MSFSMTTPQMYAGTKFVTRRWGWKFLKVGDQVMAVEKAMGLKKGEQIKRIRPIQVASVIREPLGRLRRYDPELQERELRLEGFPDHTVDQFIQLLCKDGHRETDHITRILFTPLELVG